jgi:hypothetical protein
VVLRLEMLARSVAVEVGASEIEPSDALPHSWNSLRDGQSPEKAVD